MTWFLDHDLYSTYKWSEEMPDTFYPLIKKCIYNKGSLLQRGFETTSTTSVCIISPLFEDALASDSSHFRVTKASLIYAELQCGNEYLCEVEKFIGVTVLSNNNDYCTVWVAVVSVYMLHEQRDYFGY